MALVIRICADTISSGKGGLHATKIASLLVGRVLSRTKSFQKSFVEVIQAGFKMMRSDSPESERVQTVLELFYSMTQVSYLNKTEINSTYRLLSYVYAIKNAIFESAGKLAPKTA